MTLVQFHAGLSNACVIFSLIIAGYGFLEYLQNQRVDGGFLGVVAVGELLFLAQVVVGVLLAVTGGPLPARLWVHILYGVVLVILFPRPMRSRAGATRAKSWSFMPWWRCFWPALRCGP